MKRFYKQTGIQAVPGGFAITLDGRSIRTPVGASLVVPTEKMALAIEAEWAAQGEDIRPETMPMTQLASTAIDRIGGAARGDIVGQLVRYAGTDLLCYRAGEPKELAARQEALWAPILSWAEARFGVSLAVTNGVMPVAQSAEVLDSLRLAVEAYDDMTLSALQLATAACGSLILALALVEGRLSGEEAFAASQLDETYQIELWGEDAEATRRRKALREDVMAASGFLQLCA